MTNDSKREQLIEKAAEAIPADLDYRPLWKLLRAIQEAVIDAGFRRPVQPESRGVTAQDLPEAREVSSANFCRPVQGDPQVALYEMRAIAKQYSQASRDGHRFDYAAQAERITRWADALESALCHPVQGEPDFAPGECDGSGTCTAKVHVHGCYAPHRSDQCDSPSEYGHTDTTDAVTSNQQKKETK